MYGARERVEEGAGPVLAPGWGVEPVEEGALLGEGQNGSLSFRPQLDRRQEPEQVTDDVNAFLA